MGPGVGAGAPDGPRPDPRRGGRRAAAALARMAGRLGRPTADRRRPAPGPEGRRGRAGADRAPHLDRAPHSLPHNGSRGMTAYAIIGADRARRRVRAGIDRARFRPDQRPRHRHDRAAPAPGVPPDPDDPAQRVRHLAGTARARHPRHHLDQRRPLRGHLRRPGGAVPRHRPAAQPAHRRFDGARGPDDAARALVRTGKGRVPHRGPGHRGDGDVHRGRRPAARARVPAPARAGAAIHRRRVLPRRRDHLAGDTGGVRQDHPRPGPARRSCSCPP